MKLSIIAFLSCSELEIGTSGEWPVNANWKVVRVSTMFYDKIRLDQIRVSHHANLLEVPAYGFFIDPTIFVI